MLLLKYYDPKLGYETEEKVHDDEYYSFANRTPNINQAIDCFKVVASGKWLERIQKHFSGLPMMETGVHAPTIAWYGDHAKFISGNIADVCSAFFQFWMGEEKPEPVRHWCAQLAQIAPLVSNKSSVLAIEVKKILDQEVKEW